MSPRRLATAYVRLAVTCAVASFWVSACDSQGNDRPIGRGPVIVLHDTAGTAAVGEVEIHNITEAERTTFRALAPDDPSWTAVLAVRTAGADQAVIGRYEETAAGIRFTPAFPPVAGLDYHVRYSPGNGAAPIDTVMLVQQGADTDTPTRVAAMHPAADSVPMNLLRAYIQFSSPMSEGEAYDRIRLLDGSGEVVPDAFLVLEHELWDPERTRFTILFDPGRIKRGLVPNEELGLPLREGNHYTFVVDAAWMDARGRPLASGFQWSFVAGPPDRTSPRPEDWNLVAPVAGSRDPATLETGETLDHALLERLITVQTADGNPVSGSVTVSSAGNRWSFTPAGPWMAGEYILEIGTELEDLAGNNLRHLFDVDTADRQDTGVTGSVIHLRLSIR